MYILYSHFRSALSQVPTLEKLLPVSLSETNDATAQQLTEYLYEPGIEQLLASLLPRITDVAVQRALLEATASEHGARMKRYWRRTAAAQWIFPKASTKRSLTSIWAAARPSSR